MRRIMKNISASPASLLAVAIVLIAIFAFSPYEPASAAQQYDSGMYKIGTDMDPGEYVLMADEGTDGYFRISADANQDDMIQFGFFEYDMIVTVSSDLFLEFSDSYAVALEDADALDLTGAGMFKVGTNLVAGEYNLIADENSDGYYCIYDDNETWKVSNFKLFENNAYVSVEDGQYLKLESCHIEDPVAPSDTGMKDTTGDSSTLRIKADTGALFDSDCIIDELGWIADVSETGKRLDTFYDMTGVQPYVYLKAYDDSLITDEEKAEYAENWYEENIDNEGTFLYIYFAEEDTNEDIGYMYCMDGYEIDSVMDEEAIDIFWDNVELYWYSDLSTDDMLVRIFDSTAEAIM